VYKHETTILSAAEQAELVLAWQAETDPVRRSRLIAQVLDSIERLLETLVTARLRSMPPDWQKSVREDCLGDARVAALEALHSWSPTGGSSVSSWTHTRVTHALNATRFRSGGGAMPEAWEMISRKVSQLRRQARESGVVLNEAELAAIVEQTYRDEYRESVLAKTPGLSEDEIERKVHDRLSRRGLIRAFPEFAQIMVAVDGTVSFDHVDDAGVSLHDTLSDTRVADDADDESVTGTVAKLLCGLSPTESAVIYAKYMEATPPTLTALAATYQLAKPQVKAILKKGESRITAPHAQWCRLAPDVPGQVDRVVAVAVAGGGDVSSRISRRLNAAAR
jgi:hypothetical protein